MDDARCSDELGVLRREVRLLRTALNRRPPGLDLLLRRRGFTVYKKEPADKILIPQPRRRTGFYRMLHKYSFRLFLRDAIRHRDLFTIEDVSRYAGLRVAGDYIDYLRSIGLAKKKANACLLTHRRITSFGETLEWYIAEMFKREFGCEAVWGVKFRRPRVGGDYDVIAKMGEALLYVEVKSSPPKQIFSSEITAFLDRITDLAPDLSVFFVDTELRMKDKIVPLFEEELRRRRAALNVEHIERELFAVGDSIFIMNAKESVLRNFEFVLNRSYQTSFRYLMPPAYVATR